MKETVYTLWGFDFTTDYMTMLASIFTGITTIFFYSRILQNEKISEYA